MVTYILIGLAILAVFAIVGSSAEKAVLTTYVNMHEEDAAARMLKFQTIQNLDNVKDPFIRNQIVSGILKD